MVTVTQATQTAAADLKARITERIQQLAPCAFIVRS
jgi:hypothetical protein